MTGSLSFSSPQKAEFIVSLMQRFKSKTYVCFQRKLSITIFFTSIRTHKLKSIEKRIHI